ncbi:MAG: hypothetical protein AVDCRST_MAG13-3554, partial [uncultured Solirubrobacteraceae bacterium]
CAAVARSPVPAPSSGCCPPSPSPARGPARWPGPPASARATSPPNPRWS